MFSVKLNVHEDKELREYIQQLIRGQVRSGIKGVIEDEIRKLTEKKYGGDGLEYMIGNMVNNARTKDTKLRKLVEKEAERFVKSEVARVFRSYREDYSDIEPAKPRKLDLPTVTVSKGLKNV